MMSGVVAVLLAGGRGRRMGAQVPKQELELDGKKIYRITAERFAAFPGIDRILFVGVADRLDEYQAGLAGIPRLIGVIAGGVERYDSVWNALESLKSDPPEVVLMHDAVRPFVSERTVADVIRVARESGAVSAAVPATDTIFEIHDGIVTAIPDRKTMWQVQTPQGFQYDLLRRAHEDFRRRGGETTDDARLIQSIGHPVRVVEGTTANLKITRAEDLTVASVLYRELTE